MMIPRPRYWMVPALAASLVCSAVPAGGQGSGLQRFERDPGWISFRSRLVPNPAPFTTQQFGATPDRGPGAFGGKVQRSLKPARFGRVIPTANMDQRLEAEGTFRVVAAEGGSGALVGWYRHDSAGWRTPNSLAFRVDGNGGKFWVFFEYGTRHWLTGGGGCFSGEAYQTTRTPPLLADGKPHVWKLVYEPKPAGDAELSFTLDGTRYPIPVSREHRLDGADFDRFGIFNQMTSGGSLEMYVSEMKVNGAAVTPREGRWEGDGNNVRYEDRAGRPLHDFGFSPTGFAGGGGGSPGEIGGLVWRDEAPAYYAAAMPALSLDQPMKASGRLVFRAAGSDSGVALGWFDSATKEAKRSADHEQPQKNLLALVLEGPSRIGHYLRPILRSADGNGTLEDRGPVLRPDGLRHTWSMAYDPNGAAGRGLLTWSLDDNRFEWALPEQARARGARFDRFGWSNLQSGGTFVEVYLDDLQLEPPTRSASR